MLQRVEPHKNVSDGSIQDISSWLWSELNSVTLTPSKLARKRVTPAVDLSPTVHLGHATTATDITLLD